MDFLRFQRFEYSKESLTDDCQLVAFALGAQHSSLYNILHPDSTVPVSLEHQERLESAAKYYWEIAQRNSLLKQAASQHAKALLGGRNFTFEDVWLHLAHPELPLVKYYNALIEAKGVMDKDKVWQQHLIYSRTLYLAMYEHSREPAAELCYNANSVMVSIPKSKQCLLFNYNATSQCFHLEGWHYYLKPMPWGS
jgi:hypothetical protein